MLAAIHASHALPGEGAPEDLANAIVFPSSDDSASITGALLPVDGGLSAFRAFPQIAEVLSAMAGGQ
jgi:NAD(P)-dependent dehydrogenase (short-subunit alcohol dehydrogenase family)